MSGNIWIVGYEDGKFWCANRSPIVPPLSSADTYERAMESALNEATLLMTRHPIRWDIAKAKVVYHPSFMFGLAGFIQAPEYVDYDENRKTPDQVWVVEAPTRYQAIKIAKQDFNRQLLEQPGC